MTPPHLAVSIVAAGTGPALAAAAAVAAFATLVEYRLDLMGDFDLARLISQSPLPCIITCRSRDQGGQFAGTERERRQILREALARFHCFVDVEAEALPELAPWPGAGTVIGSHHDFQGMIGDWASAGLRLREMGAGIVKLAGAASSTDDVLPPLAWLHGLRAPGIAIAMGTEGVATRLLAPRFPAAFLSFAATAQASTAAGQIPAGEMATVYGYHDLVAAAPLLVLLAPPPIPWPEVVERRAAVSSIAAPGANPVLLPIPATHLSPGLLLALLLAGVHGLCCLPGVDRQPALREYGLDPAARVWRLDHRPFLALAELPASEELARFWLSGQPNRTC